MPARSGQRLDQPVNAALEVPTNSDREDADPKLDPSKQGGCGAAHAHVMACSLFMVHIGKQSGHHAEPNCRRLLPSRTQVVQQRPAAERK